VTYLVAENNLSDLTNVSAACSNLGLGTAALENIDALDSLTSTVPSGTVFGHDPTASPSAGGYQFCWAYGASGFTNGPVGQTNYIDDTWAFGENVGGLSFPLDSAKQYVALHWESKFYNGARFGSEFHLIQIAPTGGAGTTLRPLTMFLPHDGGNGGGIGLYSGQVALGTHDGNQCVALQNTNSPSTVDLLTGTYLRGALNNVPVIQQMNSSAAFVNLPYLDSGDLLRVSQGIVVIGPRAGSGAVYPGQFVTFQPVTAHSGDVVLGQIGPAVTGSLYAQQMYAAPSTGLIAALWNGDATHATAHAYHYIRTNGNNAGDPFIDFQIVGTTDWSIGIDNSDSDKFKISCAATLGTNDKLVLDGSGNLSIEGVMRPKSFTVATLPTPSAACAGAMAYASDGRKSGEGPGAGTGIPVWCDGANWQTFYDNTVASA
jgi:hypothetical protein